MTALQVFSQNDGTVTTAYYERLNQLGAKGQLAVALFRAQKRSARAKQYRRGRWRRQAYDVKAWSMEQICKVLEAHPELGITYGWKQDPAVPFDQDPSWVLYVDLPQGQVSFHSPSKGPGPNYPGDWDRQHLSQERILAFCEEVELKNEPSGKI